MADERLELRAIDVLGIMDQALVYLSRRQRTADEEIQIFFDEEFEDVGARTGDELVYIMRTLVERNLVGARGEFGGRRNSFFRLTPEGWRELATLSRARADSTQVFVAMAFDDDLLPVYTEGIEPALIATGYRPYRSDRVEQEGRLDDAILAEIRRSRFIVADFTRNNRGVYFESGFALGLNTRVVHTCRQSEMENVHFDTRTFRHVLWDDPADLCGKLITRIEGIGLSRA